MAAANKPSFRVFCKAAPDYNLSVSEGMAILAPVHKNDDRQHWYKEVKYTNKEGLVGYHAFALINKATGQTLKHAVDHPEPVRLVAYNENVDNERVLWALADDRGEGYKAIKSLEGKIYLEAAALYDCSYCGCSPYHGAIIMGGIWIDANNQQWKIEPHTS